MDDLEGISELTEQVKKLTNQIQRRRHRNGDSKERHNKQDALVCYNSLTKEAKHLLTYFTDSFRRHQLLPPDSLFPETDPKGFIKNAKAAELLVSEWKELGKNNDNHSLQPLFATIDICHQRLHNWWGKVVPLTKVEQIKKAYNHFVAEGLIKVSKDTSYGSSEKVF